jgi:hypothetical protein
VPLTYRSLLCLSLLALSFLALFHALVIRELHPGFLSESLDLSPVVAGLWALGAVEAWLRNHRLAPVLALGFFAAMGYGFLLRSEGSALVGWAFVLAALVGQAALGKLYFRYLPRAADNRGEEGPHLLNHGGGKAAPEIRRTR